MTPRTGRSTSWRKGVRPPWSANPIRPSGKRSATVSRSLGTRSRQPTTAKDALKAMRFHVFDVVVLNELFDAADPQANSVLNYLRRDAHDYAAAILRCPSHRAIPDAG